MMNKGLENTINKLADKHTDELSAKIGKHDYYCGADVFDTYKKGFIDATNLQDIKLKNVDDKLYSKETIIAFIKEARKVAKISGNNKAYKRLLEAVEVMFKPKEEVTLL